MHAHMDLLKMAMRLAPYVESELIADCLEVAIAARTLDVAASPYDASAYGVATVPIEEGAGRKAYRARQEALMESAAPVRARLLHAYDAFLDEAFGPARVAAAIERPGDERYATASPGGRPWRHSRIPRPEVRAAASPVPSNAETQTGVRAR